MMALFNCSSGGHAFKIRIVNVQKVIEVPRSRIKGLVNISLIIMVKRIHEISFVVVKKNKSATRGEQFVLIGIPTICLYNLIEQLLLLLLIKLVAECSCNPPNKKKR